MKESISVELAEREFGITSPHERMDNGELRFRLLCEDGNGYVRTLATSFGGWQNSHSHSAFREFYLIELGWIAFATPGSDARPIVQIFHPGDIYISPLGEVHNVYLAADSVMHTIRLGIRGVQPLWESAAWFDAQTQHLTEAEIFVLAGVNKNGPPSNPMGNTPVP